MLHVSLDVNGWALEEVFIRRLEQLKAVDAVHRYSVGTAQNHEMATFEHKYSEGALTCLRKGLEALGN